MRHDLRIFGLHRPMETAVAFGNFRRQLVGDGSELEFERRRQGNAIQKQIPFEECVDIFKIRFRNAFRIPFGPGHVVRHDRINGHPDRALPAGEAALVHPGAGQDHEKDPSSDGLMRMSLNHAPATIILSIQIRSDIGYCHACRGHCPPRRAQEHVAKIAGDGDLFHGMAHFPVGDAESRGTPGVIASHEFTP
jgi:hypothetical protein